MRSVRSPSILTKAKLSTSIFLDLTAPSVAQLYAEAKFITRVSEAGVVYVDVTTQALDRFDRVRLEDVLGMCLRSASLADAERVLFAQSRAQKNRKRFRSLAEIFATFWDQVGIDPRSCEMNRLPLPTIS